MFDSGLNMSLDPQISHQRLYNNPEAVFQDPGASLKRFPPPSDNHQVAAEACESPGCMETKTPAPT
ncbi:hypothetical protein ACAM_0858 [Aeropyrum camini SY1 = JCM 12091]|uniref:Uncharacterized protein n=1 Tax=Aeropyrum camini SY1 = JCM 12091 TaxID=1198449 RepID=U3T9W5_9CREN|nr:hypothetical protein ACAM_0858 [Aeropyrum camini SY1 = JCM 12091]